MSEIRYICSWILEDVSHREILWSFAKADDRRVAVNALWVMTHLTDTCRHWLQSLQDELVDILLVETDTSKKRMLLQLLREQEFNPDNIRTDLLDYCFSNINSEREPYAVRCFSLYVAFKMCMYYPELLTELEQYLEVLSHQQLSPGLRSALRQTRARIGGLHLRRLK